MTNPLLAIMGPTCSGKTALAIALAKQIDGEIVSCDSAAVFIGLDIGTAKPTAKEQAEIPHHVIDTIVPTAQWTAANYAAAADVAIADIRARNKTPILCGGTGLWMRALVHGIFEAPDIAPAIRDGVRDELAAKGSEAMHGELALVDPVAASRIETRDPQRIGRALEVFRQTGTPISTLQARHGFREERHRLVGVALSVEKSVLWSRIARRTAAMYKNGLLEETARCLDDGVPADAPGLAIIGYRDAVRVIRNEWSVEDAVERTSIETRQYAKRQANWFNKEPAVTWINADLDVDEVRRRLYARFDGGVGNAQP